MSILYFLPLRYIFFLDKMFIEEIFFYWLELLFDFFKAEERTENTRNIDYFVSSCEVIKVQIRLHYLQFLEDKCFTDT
jgi:hypothetical protein